MASSSYNYTKVDFNKYDDFVVEEGPFTANASKIYEHSQYITLHIKHLPKYGGPNFPKLTIRFYRNNGCYYSVSLGRHNIKSYMYKEHLVYDKPCARDIHDLWKNLEKEKVKKLNKQDFKIDHIVIKNETIIINQIDEFDELTILQYLNRRRENQLQSSSSYLELHTKVA